MTKPWSEQPLWWKVYMRDDRAHMEAAKIIGYLGCGEAEFWDAAKKLPNYDKYRFETAVRDLTVFSLREGPTPRYEFHPAARRCVRVLLGPPPEDPEYVTWWRVRLLSAPDARPPVPLPEIKEEPKPKKPAKKRAKRAKG